MRIWEVSFSRNRNSEIACGAIIDRVLRKCPAARPLEYRCLAVQNHERGKIGPGYPRHRTRPRVALALKLKYSDFRLRPKISFFYLLGGAATFRRRQQMRKSHLVPEHPLSSQGAKKSKIVKNAQTLRYWTTPHFHYRVSGDLIRATKKWGSKIT